MIAWVCLSFLPNPARENVLLSFWKLETEAWDIQSVTHSYLTMGKTVQGADIHSSPNMTHPSACYPAYFPFLYLSIQSLYGLLVSLHSSSLLEISIESRQQSWPAAAAAWLPRLLLTDQEANPPPTSTTNTTNHHHLCNTIHTLLQSGQNIQAAIETGGLCLHNTRPSFFLLALSF